MICWSLGPPSVQEEHDNISRVHSPGYWTAETPLPRRPRCRAPWKACTPLGASPGLRHHFPVAADPTAELSNDGVVLVAEVAQCVAPHAMMLPREGWEGQRHDQTPAALFIARYGELHGSGVVYPDRSETPGMLPWTTHHLVAPDMRLTVDLLDRPLVAAALP